MANHDVVTFGCRLNSFESEVIRSHLKSCDNKDVIVFNTCAVTKEAERQARQAIRKAKKKNPDTKVVITGCSAQINPEQYSSMPEVDTVLGNEEKLKKEHYQNLFSEKAIVNDIMAVKETAPHLVSSFEGRARAFIQVQNGCNHRCTFCIIPYGRGNSRSVPIGEIVKQTKELVTSGYKEVVVTGVDITDYGKDLPGEPTLGEMIKRLLTLVPELPRLRLSSIDVAEIDPTLMELICTEKRVMPHIHISLQAGDDMVLKRMKRRHTRQQVIDFCHNVREQKPEIAFGADIIAGFPTETDEMFQNTLNLIKEAGIQHVHVFPYSEREGTPAARMPQVPNKIRKERAAKLRAAGELELINFLKKKLNKTVNVIIEKDNNSRDEDYSLIKIDKDVPSGEMVSCIITGMQHNYLTAQVTA